MATQQEQRPLELTGQMKTRMALLDHYGTMPSVLEAWREGLLTATEEQAFAHLRGTEVLLSMRLYRLARSSVEVTPPAKSRGLAPSPANKRN